MSEPSKHPVPPQITAPLTGRAVSLENVPDPVFADKVLGDGLAILPEEGRVYSPVAGTVSSVAETLHAYGFASDDGLEVLVHVGLDTVALKGEGFRCHVKEGDRVRVGDLVAEVDLDLLSSRGIDPITPVLICDGGEGKTLQTASGPVQGGVDPVITLNELNAASEPNKGGLGGSVNFDLLQKLGKVLMTVIAVMPAAGLMLSLGKLVQMLGADIALAVALGSILENIGWAIINNLHVLFAVAIGGSWAKERAGGAFAAVISFVLINCITGAAFGVTNAMLDDPTAVVVSLLGEQLLVKNYFTSVLGAPALNMGVFVGIISGFVGGIVYNKYYNFRRLPDALAFFNGKRFVPLAVIAYSAVISAVMALVWPVIQSGINAFGVWIANSADTSPILAPFIYGTLERLLLPFGLHHMLTIPMNYTSFGGTYLIQTGVNAGSQVFGQDPLWLAWVTDLINFRDMGPTRGC